MHLWEFMEQIRLAKQNNLSEPFYEPPGTIGKTLNGLCGQSVPAYYCPSDNGSDLNSPDAYYQRRRGNYVVNWGATKYDTAPARKPARCSRTTMAIAVIRASRP